MLQSGAGWARRPHRIATGGSELDQRSLRLDVSAGTSPSGEGRPLLGTGGSERRFRLTDRRARRSHLVTEARTLLEVRSASRRKRLSGEEGRRDWRGSVPPLTMLWLESGNATTPLLRADPGQAEDLLLRWGRAGEHRLRQGHRSVARDRTRARRTSGSTRMGWVRRPGHEDRCRGRRSSLRHDRRPRLHTLRSARGRLTGRLRPSTRPPLRNGV